MMFRMDRRAWVRRACVVLFAASLAGCATPYQPHGLGGGYRDEKIADNVWKVSFFGNGYASEDLVVKYWLYRSAELTIQHGYRYFALEPNTPRSALPPDVLAYDSAPGERARMMREAGLLRESGMHTVRGGVVYVPSYSSHTITTWSKTSVVVMYSTWAGSLAAGQGHALHAQTVLDMLKPYVASRGKEAGPSRQEVIEAAMKHMD